MAAMWEATGYCPACLIPIIYKLPLGSLHTHNSKVCVWRARRSRKSRFFHNDLYYYLLTFEIKPHSALPGWQIF